MNLYRNFPALTHENPFQNNFKNIKNDKKYQSCNALCSKLSKRLFFNKRENMQDNPLLIICFEGVIGDEFRDSIFSSKSPKYFLRAGKI